MTPHSEDTAESARILVVDDDATLRNALSQYLGHRGFDVHQAESGDAALERLREGGFSLMLLDVHIPGMAGPDIVPEALDIDPDLAILMVTAAGDATTAAICMQRGAVDYLTKPIELNDLGGAIDRALRRRDTMLQERGITDWLKQEVARQTEEIRHEQQKLERVTLATLEALINALEAKNEFLSGHSARIAAYSAGVATELELSDDEIETIRVAGRLHDLGKIGIREGILDKKGPLTPEEYAHVKQHVVIGAEILAPLDHLGPIVGYVKHHHEHWDGNGYPDGLAGEDIPLGARIICAAEIYDALTTSRPYQDRLEPDDAIERMRVLSGSVVDPTVMEAFANSVVHHRQLVFLEDEIETPRPSVPGTETPEA